MKNYDFNKFAEKFVDDSHNLLNEIEGKLLELEQDTSNLELIEAVFRVMHTLKGVGSMFGFTVISEYTHHLETIYDKIRGGKLALDASIFEITFASVDHLRNLLDDQHLKNQDIAARHLELTRQIENLVVSKHIFGTDEIGFFGTEPQNKGTNLKSSWYIQFYCSDELIKRAINISFLFQDLAVVGDYEIFKHSPEIQQNLAGPDEVWGIHLNTDASLREIEEVFMFVSDFVKIVRLPEHIPHENSTGNSQKASVSIMEAATAVGSEFEKETVPLDYSQNENFDQKIQKQSFKIPRISVGTDKLDKLMYLVSELFTTRSELVTATSNGDMARIKVATEKIDKLSAQFRNNALSIRLVPLRELTLKFKRLIRDLSNQLGKNIDFEIQGDETELDKNLVDNLADPFMHLIRNCIDHGIESSEVRHSLGKSENGTIRFAASQSGNYIYIKISDDGKGIDKEYIRRKAIEKGFLQPNTQLSERELLELIFLPGFSTAESLTQVSGRGVGMDVVKRSITGMRGSIDIETELGRGTSFTIKLQQTIAIMDTLMVRSGNSHFMVLLEEVEICELESHKTLYSRQNNHLRLADDLIPFVSLRQAFSISGEFPQTERIIVIKRQDLRFAIVADTIIGQYQAVIKPLGRVLKHKEYLSGASIMGDGNIAFMIDTQKLSKVISKIM